MPRKTNGMPFEIHPSPKKAENGKNILYVRPRSRQKITMEQLEYPFGEQSAETFQQCLFILITEEMLQSAQDHRRFLLMIADAVQRVTGKPGRML